MSRDDSQIACYGWMRASDRDRDAAVAVLRDAYTVGRLDLDELRDRTAAACTAGTWGELLKLTADLPSRPYQDRCLARLMTKMSRPPGGQARRAGRPFAPMGLMGLVWLAIAAAAPMPAAAIPLVLLALFALWAACWKVSR
jgi:hypothetical protein